MKYKPDEGVLAAYLYDELAKEEKAKVEAYLADNPDARKELEEIKSMQQIMGKLEDNEVQEPSFVFEESPVVVVSGSQKNVWMKAVMGIAASIALLILMGYITQLKFEVKNGNATLSFGEEIIQPAVETISKEDVQSWMAEAMNANNDQLLGKITEVETNLSEKVAEQQRVNKQQMNSMLASYKIDQTVIDQYVSQLRDENKDIILSLMEVSEQGQKQYIDNVMADFTAYLDQQRVSDLDAIQTSFDNLKDHTEISQIETNEILASIISTVNNDNTYDSY